MLDNLNDGNDKNNQANCGKMKSFKNLVKKLEKDGEITTDQADLLNDTADNIKDLLGCK